jgi:hypothetical protein
MKKYIALLMVAAFAVSSYAGEKACAGKDAAACAGKDKSACAGKEQAACCAGKGAVAKGSSCSKAVIAKKGLQSPKAAGNS